MAAAPAPAGRVVVVGAGYGGLAAAIRLAAGGARVTVLEREPIPGGRAGRIERDGFAFDTGPSVLTMPHLLDDLFALAGERLADHVRLQRLDPAYRATFHDGSVLRVRGSVEAMIAEVRDVCGPEEADRFARLVVRLRRLYEAEFGAFIDRNFDSAADLVRPVAMARLVRLGGFRRLQPLVSGILSDWRLVRLFTFQSMYAGMSPYEALGVYAVIAYMDAVAGVYAVKGGVAEVSRALAGLAERMGVEIHYGAEADEVEIDSGRAVAVRASGGHRHPCDVAVLNPDLPVAYRDLLPAEVTPRRVGRLRYSPSCVVVHLGLDRPLEGAAHHNIHFAEDYRASFDDVLSGRLQRDPSWFLSVPTKSDPALAPAGGEVAYWLLPVPNLERPGIDWAAQAPRELRRAQRLIEGAGYGEVAGSVVASEVVTPLDWAERGMAAGTPFAASHRFAQTGPLRPANVARRVDGVVFAGSGTVPGVGVPMVLLSGKLAAARATEMLEARRGAAA